MRFKGMKMTESAARGDYDLIRGYLDGRAEDFDLLYERYRRPVYAYLNNLLPPAAADDLFQQLWLKVIDKLPNYRHRDRFPAWLFRIAHNLVIDQFRREKRRGSEVALDEPEVPELAEVRGEPWRGLANEELQRALEAALAELQTEQREVFLLRQQEMSFREIAALQKCSINTALARMQYALKNLQRKLQSWAMPGGEV